PGLKAERHSPDVEDGPTAVRHDPHVSGGRTMRSSRAPTEELGPTADRFTSDQPGWGTGPLHARQAGTQNPELPIPPIPVLPLTANWGLLVVRTQEGFGVAAEQLFPLKERTRIGRHGAIDIKLLDPKVSRQHADIVIKDTSCRIIDLNSSNGTFVNGQRIKEPVELIHGDTIRIGDTQFMVVQQAK
ncbi:MAG: FHA domain-containing protein, partial [Candidatus Promineifilaceae bacterium]